MLSIRDATEKDLADIETMVADFVRGHPAENHPRSRDALREAYFGARPVARLLVAEKDGCVVGMGQWRLIHDMFWGMFGAEAEWLFLQREFRGRGIAAAIVARICAQARAQGAEFLHGAGDGKAAQLYERVAIGSATRHCHLSGRAFDHFADLDGLPVREIIRGLPPPEWSLEAKP
jgi:GNAT superfamily N-acetyltransferase